VRSNQAQLIEISPLVKVAPSGVWTLYVSPRGTQICRWDNGPNNAIKSRVEHDRSGNRCVSNRKQV